MSSLGLQNVGALDSRKIVSLISERMRTSRISIFNYVWIVFLVIQVSFTARGLTPIFSFPQSTWLSIIASAVINYLLVFLVLLIFHSSNNILGDIGHHKKTKQHLIGFSAILVGLALYLIVTVTYLRFWYLDWLFEIYILVTFFISYFGIFIVLPFWGRSYIKSIGKCAQALMIVEAHSIIQDLNNQRFSDKFVRGSIIRRNNRFWLYFDAFILNCDMPEEKTYLVFLEPAARFFDIQHKSRHSFNRDILLKVLERIVRDS